jgi:pimeloyl-ACP methyl ester carboxylesterase
MKQARLTSGATISPAATLDSGEAPPSKLKLQSGMIAYRSTKPRRGYPTVVFLSGLNSDMGGTKARYLAETLPGHGLGYLRFDNLGHGASSGNFVDQTVSSWVATAIEVMDRATRGPLLLVGSSIGAWVAVKAALARPDRVIGLVTIAAAPDCTEDLMWSGMDMEQRLALASTGVVDLPSDYGDPYPISRALIEDGRRNLVLRAPVSITCPARLLHGMADPDVPVACSLRLAEVMGSQDLRVTLIKNGDHRLSRPDDLALTAAAILELAQLASKAAKPSR